MPLFTVNEVVDGDTFKVKTDWSWRGKKGNIVRPAGYDTPERGERSYEEAKQRLAVLILNEQVDIKDFKIVDKWDRLVAEVYFKGKNLADYFPEYKS